MGTAAQTLAEFVAALRIDDIPQPVVAAARRSLADAMGVAVAAASRGLCGPVVDMVRSWAGAREATVLGHDLSAPAPLAALANGALARALDYDDTHVESLVHPSAVVMPAALAVGEETGALGRDLVAAAIAGYEVAARVGAAAPGRFLARGLDTTGVCGPFAATAVAGRLWGLSAEQTAHAFGIAGSHASGLLSPDGGESTSLHAGWAAHAGVLAADLARRGFTGLPTVFDGPNSVFDALLTGEEPDRGRITRGLGSEWETLRIAIKPYPASHFVHAFMDAAVQCHVRWAEIEEVECFVSPAAIPIVAEPREPRLHPATAAAARHSLPFAVATAIVGGRDPLDMFERDARLDRRVLAVAERVHHHSDSAITLSRAFGGRVRIVTRGGRVVEVDEPVNKGHPDRPLSDAEITEKFGENARARMDPRMIRRALAALHRLDEIASTDALAALFRAS